MANSYCKKLSNSYRIAEKDGSLGYQPCCWIRPRPIPNKKDIELIRTNYIKDIENDKEKYCYECINREKYGYQESTRQFSNRIIPNNAVDGDAYELELQLNSTCNAACIICGPWLSSLWRKQLGINEIENNFDYKDALSLINLENLKTMKFLGGEPLLGDTHFNVLKMIPHPEKVEIRYATNGSIFPDEEVFEVWSRFKNIKIFFSIDGTDKVFEYIRWPLGWNKVEKNIIKMLDKNVNIGINCTINPLNAFYFDNLEEWGKKYNIKISTSSCHGKFGINRLPLSLKLILIEKYGADHNIIKIIEATPEDTNQSKQLINDLEKNDSARNISWKEAFPDIVDYITHKS
jgi:molybdenum cofactor biosynthesis enzyme MoaA